ncbi:MAG: TonB-dependent receptor [Acidobacteriota bacterium]
MKRFTAALAVGVAPALLGGLLAAPAPGAEAPSPGAAPAAAASEDADAAGSPPDGPAESGVIERVRVEAPADRTPLLDSTSFSTVILRQDLDRRMLDLPQALRASAGVQVQSFGGLGNFATVSIRGSSSEQVEVYVDGVPQRPVLGGGVNLADLPALALERVEVYRGFTPTSFGPASLAGVVSIRTRAPGTQATDLRASYGSFNSARLGGLVSRRSGSWDWLGSLEVYHTDGDFGFFGTNHPQLRQNNEAESVQLLARATHAIGNGPGKARLELYNSLLVREQGVPGIQGQPTPDATFDLFRDTFQVGAALASPWGGWSLDPALYATVERQRYRNLTRSPASDERNRLSTFGLRAPLVLHPSGALRWLLSPELRIERARREDRLLAPRKRFEAERGGLFISAGAEWETAAGNVLLAPSLRWTALESSFDGLEFGIPTRFRRSERNTSGRLGLRLKLTNSLALKANAGRFFREPSLTELYGNSGLIQGNPALSPERGEHADLGLSWSRPGTGRAAGRMREFHVEGSIFVTRADELILLFPTGGGTVKPQNSGKARITGVELSGGLAISGGWILDLAYTRQRPEDTSGLFGLSGKLLPGRPLQELHAGVHLRRGRWGWLYRYSFIDENFTDRKNTRTVPDRHLHTLGVRFAPVPKWELSLEAENLTDQRIGDLAGFPLPGRMVTARLRYRP